jgi:FkbM family methyltransferase
MPKDYRSVFADLGTWTGHVPAGYDIDFLGIRTSQDYLTTSNRAPSVDRFASSDYPPLDEEIFEWSDLIAAVQEARERFVMVELGAGWGRWLIRSVGVMRRLGRSIPFQLIGVEAEPTHFKFLYEHFHDNDVDPAAHMLINAAVSKDDGHVAFATGHARERYGQCIVDRPIDFASYGWTEVKIVTTSAISLQTLLGNIERVDLIDMDIQGAEFYVVAAAIDVVNAKVRRMHIETHSKGIEDDLRPLLVSQGWECLNDYTCYSGSETPYGRVEFVGGVQTWLNPRLAAD